MNKFSVLPTDSRFLDMYEEQKLGIYLGINNLPENKDVKRIVQVDTLIDDIKKKDLEEFASKGLVDRMKKTFKLEGIAENEIKKRVRDYLMKIRDAEIKNLEKMREKK